MFTFTTFSLKSILPNIKYSYPWSFLFAGLITICLKYLFPSLHSQWMCIFKVKVSLLSSRLLDLGFFCFLFFCFFSIQIPSSLQWQRGHVMTEPLPPVQLGLPSLPTPHLILSVFWSNHGLFPLPGILFPLYEPEKLLYISAFSVKTECLEKCRFFIW